MYFYPPANPLPTCTSFVPYRIEPVRLALQGFPAGMGTQLYQTSRRMMCQMVKGFLKLLAVTQQRTYPPIDVHDADSGNNVRWCLETPVQHCSSHEQINRARLHGRLAHSRTTTAIGGIKTDISMWHSCDICDCSARRLRRSHHTLGQELQARMLRYLDHVRRAEIDLNSDRSP